MTSSVSSDSPQVAWTRPDEDGVKSISAWGAALGAIENSPLSVNNLTSDSSKTMFENNKDDYINHVLTTIEEKYEETYPDAIAMIEEMIELSEDFSDVKERLTQVAELGLKGPSDKIIGFKDLELLEKHGDINEDGTLTLDKDYTKPENTNIAKSLSFAEYGMRMQNLHAVSKEKNQEE